jgi:hypothetical protein
MIVLDFAGECLELHWAEGWFPHDNNNQDILKFKGIWRSRITMTIELPSDIEADLVAQARAHGLDLPRYVEHLLREHVHLRTIPALSPAEQAAAWRESTRGLPRTPSLSDDAISRESIHGDDGR